MEPLDLQILRLIEDNAQIPVGDLAVMTGAGEDAVRGRLASLSKAGIIRGTKTIIDWEKTEHAEVSAIIELKVSPERDFGYDRIAERISRFPEVRSLRLITGTYDLQLLVSGRDMQEVSRFVSEHIAPMDRIRETATHIIMKTYKENGAWLCGREEHERIPYSF